MKKAWKIGLIFTAFFLIFARILYKNTTLAFSDSIVFSSADQIVLSVHTGESFRELSLWENEQGETFFFLPAYTDLSKCCFVYDDSICSLSLGEETIRTKKFLTDFSLNVPYVFEFRGGDGSIWKTKVTFLRSAKLPALYIDTESGSLEYVHEDKEHREAAHMEIVDCSGKVVYTDNIAYIKGHGNTSWTDWEKKPYLLKLYDESSLLGMESGNKWVLFANGYDPSYIRNSLAYGLAESVGMPYTSQMRYVDLYVNKEYRGNYQLAEKIDIGFGRVDINNLQRENAKVNDGNYKGNERFDDEGIVKGVENVNNPDDITGGYLLERNYGSKYDNKVSGFITEAGESFVVRSPSYASREEIAYIANVVQHIENAILAVDGIDSETGFYYSELIDEDSFVKKYLLEEIVLNEAQGATSSWFYKPENSVSTKLYAGPVWDYDKAFGNPVTEFSYSNPCVLSKLYCYGKDQVKWFYALYDKETFLSKVKSSYQNVFLPELIRLKENEIDHYTEEIRASVFMDMIRWDNQDNFEENTDYIKNWLGERIDFLNGLWIEGNQECLIRYVDNRKSIRAFTSVPVGGALEDAPNVDLNRAKYLYLYDKDKNTVEKIEEPDIAAGELDFIGWYDKEHEKLYELDAGERVTEDITLYPVYSFKNIGSESLCAEQE